MRLPSFLMTLVICCVPSASAQETGYVTPRKPWGAPDFDGAWTNASLTPIERLNGAASVAVDEEEALALVNSHVLTIAARQEAAPSAVDDAASKKLLSDKNSSRAYNRFWMDPGANLMRVKGEYRTSYITNPSSGKIPFREGKRQNGIYFARQNYDGPETRMLQERCISYGKAGPILRSTLYNNNIQLIQTPTHFVLMSEMIHEARIIPIFRTAAEARANHGPVEIPRWFGDSVAWYEGDTLVVETVNPYRLDRSFITSQGKATERWTRWNDEEVLYEFVIDDPSIYTQDWGGEEMFRATDDPLYEYACHEGNYSLPGILAGARKLESEGREDPAYMEIFEGVVDEVVE